MTKFLPALLAATSLLACTTASSDDVVETTGTGTMDAAEVAPAQADAQPELGTFGFDIDGMDRSVSPGHDFFEYANGTWARTTEIPADKSNYGMFTRLADLSQTRTRELLDAALEDPDSKVGRAYASFLDTEAVNAAGVTPLQPYLAEIDGIASLADYARVAGELERIGLTAIAGGYVWQDAKTPTQYALYLTQSGLGLPDRDYYLDDDNAELVETRAKYRDYLTNLFALAGMDDGRARADAIYAFEEALAKVHWTQIENRDADKTYNRMTVADLDAMSPGFDYGIYLDAYGAETDSVVVNQPSALVESAAIVANTDLDVLKDHLRANLLRLMSPYLTDEFVDLNFDFTQRTLSGTPENEERWKRGVNFTTGILGEAVGQDYVAEYFPPETKAKADELVANVIAAMDRRLAGLEWMAPATRATAREKLASFTAKIGYPDEWRDYSALDIRADDLAGNAMRANVFETQRNLDKLGGPIDTNEWFMTPMTVNAYANPTGNEIVFPAAILQPPFFDPNADDAVNYGAIGAVIGHEITHHFDDQGRKYDKTGALADWWTEADIERFSALTDALVAQYDAYEGLPGMNVQGELTLGENIADLAGLTVAYDAYHASLDRQPAPVIDGFSGDQRFYLGWAQVWRRNYREENLRQRLLTDPHSPSTQRAWVVRNLDPWYSAFDPAADSDLYLSPGERVQIW